MRAIPPLLAGIFLAAAARAQTLTTLFTNGPAANRINIVVLSEGYQSAQLPQFITDARNTVSNLLTAAPYSEYSNYFNAYAISVASTNSGSNHSPYGGANTNNSYFNSSYNSFGISQLITIPPNDRDATYANGKGKVINLLTNLMPQYDIPLLLVNDQTYGGSGNLPDSPDPVVTVSLNATYAQPLVVHEAGHLIGGLADEYTNAAPSNPPIAERPNATTNTSPATTKWNAWFNFPGALSNSLPFPDDQSWDGYVASYQGAQYHGSGWYRPTFKECVMENVGWPLSSGTPGIFYCPVCSEAVVEGFYISNRVNSADSFSPASATVTLTTTQAVAFSVTPLQPRTHSLAVQWFTNGVAATGATNSAYNFPTARFTNGSHTVRATLRDNTAFVRNDPNNYLSNAVTWNVTVGFSSLKLLAPARPSGTQFSCIVTGLALNGFVMQTSTNFTNWSALSTNALTNGVFNFTNNPAAAPSRYYRAVAN